MLRSLPRTGHDPSHREPTVLCVPKQSLDIHLQENENVNDNVCSLHVRLLSDPMAKQLPTFAMLKTIRRVFKTRLYDPVLKTIYKTQTTLRN